MPEPDPLIRTKLRPPLTRSTLVSRPRLHERMVRGLRGPLTLVVAPAGFGKTTLVASSVRECGLPLAWVSLDKDDDNSGRFLSYLIACLRKADESLGHEAESLRLTPSATPEAVVTSLINDLDAAGMELVLVLDDYQWITNAEVHLMVTFLVDHCPPSLHLVIASRSDPPLPLSRWRARGYALELRAADLRFTELEAEDYLNGIMALGLDEHSVAVLAARTEGWIAGLQMAALSMAGRDDSADFIETFSGSNRYVLDYLLEEVPARRAPDIQHFLLRTSILERLSALLCQAILTAETRQSQTATIPRRLAAARLQRLPAHAGGTGASRPLPGASGRRPHPVPVPPPLRRPTARPTGEVRRIGSCLPHACASGRLVRRPWSGDRGHRTRLKSHGRRETAAASRSSTTCNS